jgi:hypothetical protein
MSTVNVLADSLVIAGITFPASGESDRYRISFPDSYSGADSNSGDRVHSKNIALGATLTISCYQTDALSLVMEQALAQQLVDDATPSARTPKPGSASLVLTPENATPRGATWLDCRILQQADIASARNGAVVTWVFDLVAARRVF